MLNSIRLLIGLLLGALTALNPASVRGQMLVSQVRTVLSAPVVQLDYMDAKLRLDGLIDPTLNENAVRRQLDTLVAEARAIAGPGANDEVKINSVRRVIYKAGAWNDQSPFRYDQDDPLGLNVNNKLLWTYLRTRQGNCVSMPVLFLIVADRLGLNVSLATAPLHVFIRYTDPQGRVFNIETTSGADLARPEWYRQNLPMTARAIESGLYMRTLTRNEVVALMATTVMDWALENGRYQEAIDIADAILAVNPRDAYALVKKGSAIAGLMQMEFIDSYPAPHLIPADQRQRYVTLAEQNRSAFVAAEALGWEPAE